MCVWEDGETKGIGVEEGEESGGRVECSKEERMRGAELRRRRLRPEDISTVSEPVRCFLLLSHTQNIIR